LPKYPVATIALFAILMSHTNWISNYLGHICCYQVRQLYMYRLWRWLGPEICVSNCRQEIICSTFPTQRSIATTLARPLGLSLLFVGQLGCSAGAWLWQRLRLSAGTGGDNNRQPRHWPMPTLDHIEITKFDIFSKMPKNCFLYSMKKCNLTKCMLRRENFYNNFKDYFFIHF